MFIFEDYVECLKVEIYPSSYRVAIILSTPKMRRCVRRPARAQVFAQSWHHHHDHDLGAATGPRVIAGVWYLLSGKSQSICPDCQIIAKIVQTSISGLLFITKFPDQYKITPPTGTKCHHLTPHRSENFLLLRSSWTLCRYTV